MDVHNEKDTFLYTVAIIFRPTMIKYKIDNIRDLVGHKVNLKMVQENPLCRVDK